MHRWTALWTSLSTGSRNVCLHCLREGSIPVEFALVSPDVHTLYHRLSNLCMTPGEVCAEHCHYHSYALQGTQRKVGGYVCVLYTGKLAMKNGISKYRFYIETVTVLVHLGTSRSRSPLVLFTFSIITQKVYIVHH